jgi:spermidine synthase
MYPESKVIEAWPEYELGGGLRLLGEWYRCTGRWPLLAEAHQLQRLCLVATQRAGLSISGHLFHQCAPSGVTGVILAPGSHLAIHTWPDRRSATLDVYVGSRTRNNRVLARAIYAHVRDGLSPDKENFVQVEGGGRAEVALPPR